MYVSLVKPTRGADFVWFKATDEADPFPFIEQSVGIVVSLTGIISRFEYDEGSEKNISYYVYICLITSTTMSLRILKQNSGDVDKERLGEVDMVHLAGEDCAIPVVSRYFNHRVINGFIGLENALLKDKKTISLPRSLNVVCQSSNSSTLCWTNYTSKASFLET